MNVVEMANVHQDVIDFEYQSSQASTASTSTDQEYDVDVMQAHIETCAVQLHHADATVQLQGIASLHDVLSELNNPPINLVVATGAVPHIVHLINHSNDNIRYFALCVLTNICCGTYQNVESVIQAGAIWEFVRILGTPLTRANMHLRQRACWALGNIAGGHAKQRDDVISSGALFSLLEVLRTGSDNVETMRYATWALCNMCRDKPNIPSATCQTILSTLATLIRHTDAQIEQDALWTMSFLAAIPDAAPHIATHHPTCQRIIGLLGSDDMHCLAPALQTVGNLFQGGSMEAQAMLDHGVLYHASKLAHHQRRRVRKEVFWFLSNLLTGTPQHIQYVLDADLVPVFLERLLNDCPSIQYEVAWCIINMLGGVNKAQIMHLVETTSILFSMDVIADMADTPMMQRLLEPVHGILKVRAMPMEAKLREHTNVHMDRYEPLRHFLLRLQSHANDNVRHHAVTLMAQHF